MWKLRAGQVTAYLITGTFVLVFITMFLSAILLTLFIFSQAAHASSIVEQKNQQCLNCHGNPDLKITRDGNNISLFVDGKAFKESVHGINPCTSCHAGVETVPHTGVVYGKALTQKVLEGCNNCHSPQFDKYRNSVHGVFLQNAQGASCTDCHGTIHTLVPQAKEGNPVRKENVAATCISCHDGNIAESYKRSFHGIALKYGYDKAPSCVDCHSSHDILPQNNPLSTISAQNKATTCTACHKGQLSDNWANGREHVVPEDRVNAFPLWITWKIFIVLILFDTLKDGGLVIMELLHQIRFRLRKATSKTTHHQAEM